MKLSVAIADSNAEANAFVVWRGFESSIRKAKEYGFDGVELALRSREDIDGLTLSSMLEKSNMEVSCISTGRVFASLGQYLTNSDPTGRSAAINTIIGISELAKDFGGMINLGRVRGYYADGVEPATTESLFLDSISQIAEAADKNGVTIVVEPVNRYEINFINNVEQCAKLLDRVPYKNVGIMPDVFHMNIEDDKIGETLYRYRDSIKYVHLADSNRYAPGNGHMNFHEIFEALGRANYNDWVSVEILPKPTPDEAAKAAVDYLLPFIHRHNAGVR